MKPLLLVALVLSLLVPESFLNDPYGAPRHAGALSGLDGGDPADAVLVDAPTVLPPLPLTLPHVERLVLGGTADEASGGAFEIRLTPPEVLHVVTASGVDARGALSVDVLQRRGPLGTVRLARLEPPIGAGSLDVRWTPPIAGDYVVHVRAAPGTVGAFAFALDARAPLDFPVATAATNAVRSFFGDARDGGARDHHGIDIFAPRGTPVLAAADGFVSRVGDSPRGGLHVWQRAEDDAGTRLGGLYYAHLDTVAVLAGTPVARGDVLGTVGNTGNARTTPPHLHFGWYQRFRGPADPLPLVGTARVEPPELSPGHAFASWLAVASPVLNVRAGPGTAFDVLDRLERGALVRVLGVGGRWARVRLRTTDGEVREGFVAVDLLAPPSPSPLVLERSTPLLAEPYPGAPRLAVIDAGSTLESRGRHGSYRSVETANGARGWVADGEPASATIGTSPAPLSDG